MELQRAYKVELDPNNAQRSAFAQHAGAARWAYNWGLLQKIETYKATKKSPSAIDLHRNPNVLKGIPKDDGGVPWMYEVSKCAPHAGCQRRLWRGQKALARKVEGSCNRLKARKRIARIHYQVACIRQNALHKATSEIVKGTDVICLESLNVAGMLKNRKLSRAIPDASLGEFLRQLSYKAGWAGVEVIEAGRWFPSSKMCSGCGHIKSDLMLADRTYCCSECGTVIDRDLNAAINLKNLAPSFGVPACEEDVRHLQDVSLVSATSVKQEPSRELRCIST